MYRREIELGDEYEDFPVTITVTYEKSFERIKGGCIVDGKVMSLDNVICVSTEMICPEHVVSDASGYAVLSIKDDLLTAEDVKVAVSSINTIKVKTDVIEVHVDDEQPVEINVNKVTLEERMRFLQFLADNSSYIDSVAKISFLQSKMGIKDESQTICGGILFPNKDRDVFYNLQNYTGAINDTFVEGIALIRKDGEEEEHLIKAYLKKSIGEMLTELNAYFLQSTPVC